MKSHTDPAFEHYNAIASMDLLTLLTPGTKSLDLELKFNESCKEYTHLYPDYRPLAPEPTKTKNKYDSLRLKHFN